jgi:transposase, IS30 family
MPKYRRVTYTHRCQIHALLQNGFKPTEIAMIVGFDKSTICREIKRNKTGKTYIPDRAQALANKKKILCRKKSKLDGQLQGLIKEKLALSWSPEQISGRLKKEKKALVSTPTLYRFINKDDSLRCHLRMYNRRGAGRYLQRRARPKWESSIESRPEIANQRKRVGDWERDTMYAKGGMALVCTDRKSRLVLIQKVRARTAKGIAEQTIEMIKGKRAFTMTNDNGSEFRGSVKIGIPIYYCKPMRPQQRGSVENAIGQIRRFIPRKRELQKMTEAEVKKIEILMNNKPRKCLNYKTPYEVYSGQRKLHSQF